MALCRLGVLLSRVSHSRALGVTGTAKQLSVKRIELSGGREETEPGTIAYNDSGGFRTNFDDVGI
jgi:hypothetical protein